MISHNPLNAGSTSYSRARRPFPNLPQGLQTTNLISDQFGRTEQRPSGVFLPKNSWKSPQAQAEELRKAMEAMNKHGYTNHRLRPRSESRMQLVYGPPWIDRSQDSPAPSKPSPLQPWNPNQKSPMALVYGPPFIPNGDSGGSNKIDWNNLIKPWNPRPDSPMALVYGSPLINR